MFSKNRFYFCNLSITGVRKQPAQQTAALDCRHSINLVTLSTHIPAISQALDIHALLYGKPEAGALGHHQHRIVNFKNIHPVR